MFRNALLSMGAAVFFAASAGGGEVGGKVTIAGKGLAANAVVCLEGDRKASPAKKTIVDQREKMFIPHVTVVPVGTTIEFPNNDTVFHNVFAHYNAQKFDLGLYPRGSSKTVTFDKKGVVAVLCNVHSEMSAFILVVDTPYYAITDKKGQFTIKNVAPGNYRLNVWHESGASETRNVTVSGDDLSLDLKPARK